MQRTQHTHGYNGVTARTVGLVALLAVGLVMGLAGPPVQAAPFAYITNVNSNSVSVIDTATNTVLGPPIPLGSSPVGVAVNPAGTRVYVTHVISASVSVIDTATNTVLGPPIPVGSAPEGVAVNPAGTRVYVANANSNSVSVIDTTTNTVLGPPIPVGSRPFAFGLFIGSPPVTPIPALSPLVQALIVVVIGVSGLLFLRRRLSPSG